jgi:hypothetical protein
VELPRKSAEKVGGPWSHDHGHDALGSWDREIPEPRKSAEQVEGPWSYDHGHDVQVAAEVGG